MKLLANTQNLVGSSLYDYSEQFCVYFIKSAMQVGSPQSYCDKTFVRFNGNV